MPFRKKEAKNFASSLTFCTFATDLYKITAKKKSFTKNVE